jgi:hypothetical protein
MDSDTWEEGPVLGDACWAEAEANNVKRSRAVTNPPIRHGFCVMLGLSRQTVPAKPFHRLSDRLASRTIYIRVSPFPGQKARRVAGRSKHRGKFINQVDVKIRDWRALYFDFSKVVRGFPPFYRSFDPTTGGPGALRTVGF